MKDGQMMNTVNEKNKKKKKKLELKYCGSKFSCLCGCCHHESSWIGLVFHLFFLNYGKSRKFKFG